MIDIKSYCGLNWTIMFMALKDLLKIAITQNPLLVRQRRRKNLPFLISWADWNVKWELNVLQRESLLHESFSFFTFSFLWTYMKWQSLENRCGKSHSLPFEEVCENLEVKANKLWGKMTWKAWLWRSEICWMYVESVSTNTISQNQRV